MQFCNDCGAILNLFQFPDKEQCPDCFQKEALLKKEKEIPVQTPAPVVEIAAVEEKKATTLPDDVTIVFENNKLAIHSAEGISLWSGDISKPQKLSMIIARAERIYNIRAKRNKK